MASSHGKFVWYELMTSDPAAAEIFYKTVIGWETNDAGMPGMAYTILSAGGVGVGGIMELPDDAREAGAKPGWLGYIGVDDTDAATRKVADAGGAIHKVPMDIPGVGRFSVVADPQGAAFVLFAPNMAMPDEPPDTTQPGHGGWRELRATDSAAALGFYAEMLGWAQIDALDMGPMGLYRLFAGPGAEGPIGGIMTKTPDIPRPYWLYYFNTASIGAAAARVAQAGGQVIAPPMPVPGGGWVLHAFDPQGAMFALVAPAE